MIVGGKGGYSLDNRATEFGGGGTVSGSIGSGDASVYIGYGAWHDWFRFYGGMQERATRDDQYAYAAVAMHETIHLASRYGFSDQQLAVAAHAITNIETNYPTDPSKASVLAWSRYWNDILRDRCPPVRK